MHLKNLKVGMINDHKLLAYSQNVKKKKLSSNANSFLKKTILSMY